MGVEIISNPLSVSALLSGEIDHHTAAAMRADIDAAAAAQQPKILRLDFAGCHFLWIVPPSVLSWVAIGFAGLAGEARSHESQRAQL